MAGSGGERRMVFDIRGRRRHVVKFVYAVLALLMGASLFLVVGPVNINSLLGGSSGSGNIPAQFEEQAQKIEHKLKQSPGDADLLLGLTRARSNAGVAIAREEEEITNQAEVELQRSSEAWAGYLKATDEPTASAAQFVARSLEYLASASRTPSEYEANWKTVVEAEEIVAEQQPSVGTLSTLAIYQNRALDFKGAEESLDKAKKLSNTKFERESLENKVQESAKEGREVQRKIAEIKKASKGTGKESLENPLGPLGSTSLGE